MTNVELRHSGISCDIKTQMEIIPRVGEIVDFRDGEEHHLFKVDRVVHIYEDHKINMVYITGQEMEDWSIMKK